MQDLFAAAKNTFQTDQDKLTSMLRSVAAPEPGGTGQQVKGSSVADPFAPPESLPIDAGPIGGFLASAASSIPELFGQNPTPTAAKFRAENPIMGLVSEVLPTALPYAGWYKATEASQLLSGALKGALVKTGIKETASPILYGAAKETLRFLPLELSRLGVGLATAPEENWGNLFADVGLSTVLAGGFGGIGGFFRKGGQMVDQLGRVLDADVGLKPTFQLRLLDEDAGRLVGGNLTKEQGVEQLTREALTDTPYFKALGRNGWRGKAIDALEEGNDAADAALGAMFRTKAGSGINRKFLIEGSEQDLKTLNAGELDTLIPALDVSEIKDVKDLAKSFVYPRVVDITSERGAGAFANIIDESTLKPVGNGVYMAREANDGLWVQLKKIETPKVEGIVTESRIPGTLEQTPADIQAKLPLGEGKTTIKDKTGKSYELRYAVKEDLGGADNFQNAVNRQVEVSLFDGNKEVGSTYFVQNGAVKDNSFIHGGSPAVFENHPFIDEAYRRRGLQSQMVDWFERTSGTIVRPSAPKTAADAFWAGRGFTKPTEAQIVRQGPKRFGAAQVGEGDRFLLVKTDKPQLLARDGGKVAEFNINQWSKMRPGYASSSNTLFNRGFNAVQDAMPLNDFRDLSSRTKGTRATWVSNMAAKLAEGAGEGLGLTNSATAKAMAEGLYDAFKPVMFRATDDPLYGRMFGLLRHAFNTGDEQVRRIIGGQIKLEGGAFGKRSLESGYKGFKPFSQLVHDLSDDEYRQLVRATQTQTQAEDLKKLATDGLVSPRAAEVIDEMMRLNKTVIGEDILPDLREAGLDKLFKPMEEYVAPRIWSGDFKVQVFDQRGKERWLSSAQSGAAAQAEAKAVIEEAAKKGQIWKMGPIEHAIEKDRDAQEFVEKLVLNNIGSDKEAQDIVQSAMRRLDAARATTDRPISPGLSKSMVKERTGRAGTPDIALPERSDFIKAVENHYSKLYHYTAFHAWSNRYMGEAFNLEKVNRNLFNDLMRKGRQMLGIPGELTKAQDAALKPILGSVLGNKPATRLAQQANELMFKWNLSIANPTFALVNMLSPLQTVMPMVSYINSVPDEYLAKFFQVVPRIGGDGLPKGVTGFLHPMKIMREALRGVKNPDAELKGFLERAKTDGTISAQLYENWVGPQSFSSQTLSEAYKQDGFAKFLWKAATYGADKSEEFARIVSFNAGFHLGKMRGLEGDQLYAFAKRVNEMTNFNYSVVDRSRVFTGPIGSVFGLFKNWQIHYIGMMGEFANVAINQGNWGPLVWQHVGALGLAGIGGTGLASAASGLANWYGEGDNAGYLWMQKNFGPGVGDALWFGAPYFLGTSLQASAAIPGTDVAKELGSLGNIVIWERAKALGKSVGAAWDYAEVTGENPLANTNIRDAMIAAAAPRAVTRLMSSIEGDYIKSMSTGYAQVQGVSPATRLLHGLGLNQVEIEREQVASQELFKHQEQLRNTTQNLGQALAAAIEAKDGHLQNEVYMRAMAKGVDISSVMQSARTIGRREEGDLFSRYKKEEVARYAGVMGLTR